MVGSVSETIARSLQDAEDLASHGELRAAIDLLTRANRVAHHGELECALAKLRRRGGAAVSRQAPVERSATDARPPGGDLFEIEPAELTLAALKAGYAQCGCVLVRGLVSPERVALLVEGIDAAMAAYDAATDDGSTVDRAWYDPGPMPDRVSPGLPEAVHRKALRGRGGMWTVDSPRMLFELFELVDDVGIGSLMTELFGERPLLSALKGTLRRVRPDIDVSGRWHQDGAFLGNGVGAFNVWLALTACGRDAPGLDIVLQRFERVLRDGDAQFDWSLSDDTVLEAAAGASIVRPSFEAGDALLFDHLLLHRTATSPKMTHVRHAIESWFFAPSAYPAGQLPILY
ncbi:MAG: hypothetical protein ABIP36_07445 [Acidimicrobiales bacterium]